MLLTHWLKSLDPRKPQTTRSRYQTRRRKAWAQGDLGLPNIAVVEILEDRTLLAAFTVDIATDENNGNFEPGDLSLREAIFLANTDEGTDNNEDDIIQFAPHLAGQTITLTVPDTGPPGDTKHDLNINDATGSIAIVGLGADQLTISGNSNSRVFHVLSEAEISGLTISNGVESNGAGVLVNGGDLTLRDSVISNNTANSGNGGGIRNTNGGTLLLDSSTVTGNSSGDDGGGIANGGGSVTIRNSTLSGNRANIEGGGVFAKGSATTTILNSTISANVAEQGDGGGVFANSGATTTIVNSTITGNRATGGNGGGLYAGGTETLVNTIVAGNTHDSTPSPDEISQTVETATNNLIGDADSSGSIINGDAGNLVGVDVSQVIDPMLADNGGLTLTHAFVAGSPAIDAGDNTAANETGLVTDQRGAGFPRISGGIVDIGALELFIPEVTGTADDDVISISVVADDVVVDRGGVQERFALGAFEKIVVNGGDGNDVLTVDLSVNAAGLRVIYDGQGQTGTPGDTLAVTGSADAVEYLVDDGSSGRVRIDGSPNDFITYTGLEPIVDETDADNVVLTFSSLDDEIEVTDDDGAIRVESNNGTAERVTFGVPDNSLTFNLGAGADVLTLTSLPVDLQAAVTIDGADDADEINFNTSFDLDSQPLTTTVETIRQAGGTTIQAGTANLDAGASGTVSLAGIAVDVELAIRAAEVDFLGGANTVSTSNSGGLVLRPGTVDQDIGIGGSDNSTAALDLTQTDLAAMADGFSSIAIGETTGGGTGAVTIEEALFRDWLTIQGGSISLGGLDAGTNDVTLTATENGRITTTAGDAGETDLTAGAVTLNGVVAPGGSPGLMTVDANLAIGAGDTLEVEIDGTAGAGADPNGHDQVIVIGDVEISGATLSTAGSDIAAAAIGDVFTLIDNQGSNPVSGRFVDGNGTTIEDGDEVAIGSLTFRIYYESGDGNDVVLAFVPDAFPTVYVDDDFSGAIGNVVDGDAFADGIQPAVIGLNAFDTIQAGVDAVDAGGSVIANAGTYAEQVVVSKSLTLDGATGTAGDVTVTPPAGDGLIVTSDADDVTLRDFQVMGAGGDGITVEGLDTFSATNVRSRDNAGDGIRLNLPGGSASLTNVTADDNSQNGLTINGASSLAVLGGSFSENTAVGIDVTNIGGGSIRKSFVTQNTTGLQISGSTVPTINENDLSGNTTFIDNQSEAVADAQFNFFGLGIEEDHAIDAGVIGAVDFTPYLEQGDADGGTAGFQANVSVLNVTTFGQQITGERIQEAIDVAGAATVNLGDGTFAENPLIDKDLALDGSGASTIIDADGGNGVTLANGAAMVAIRDLRITNALDGILDANAATIADLTLANLQIDASVRGGTLEDVASLEVTLTENADVADINDSELDFTGLQTLVYADVQNLTVNGDGGNDIFNVDPITETSLTVNGSEPAAPAFPGDTLNYDGPGLLDFDSSPGSGSISRAGVSSVSFQEIETIRTDFVTGRNGSNTISAGDDTNDNEADAFVVFAFEDNVQVDVVNDSGMRETVLSQPAGNVHSLTIEGSDDDDTLTVDFTGGNPIPSGGLFYNGHGTGISDRDVLVLKNGTAETVTHTFDNASGGSVGIQLTPTGPASTVTYTGLEPIDDELVAGNRIFNFSAASDQITLSNDETPGNGFSRISSVSTSETVDFKSPGETLTIHAGGGDDTLTLLSLDASFDANVTVNGGLGRDTFDLLAATGTANSVYRLNGDQAADTFNISPTPTDGPQIAISGGAPSASPGDTLNANASATIIPDGNTLGTGTLDPVDPESQVVDFAEIESLNPANPPTLSIADASITEGTGGSAMLTFTVSLSNGFVQPVTVDVTTASGSAQAGSDFTSLNQTLTFSIPDDNLDGDNDVFTQTVSVAINPDAIVEFDEEFFVNLSNANGAAIVRGTARGTITDDDTANFSIRDVTQTESAGLFNFTVSLSNPVAAPATVRVDTTTTGSNPASASSDFIPLNGHILTFTPNGARSQTATVQVLNDMVVEKDETFEVRLSEARLNGRAEPELVGLGDDTGLGTIIDDDTATLSISDVTGVEGRDFVFMISLDGFISDDVTLTADTVDDSARSPMDFTAINNSPVTFSSNEEGSQSDQSQSFTVSVKDDGISEPTENFQVELRNIAFGGLTGFDGIQPMEPVVGLGTIEDASPPVQVGFAEDSLEIEANEGTEVGGSLSFTIELSDPEQDAVTVFVSPQMTGIGNGRDAVLDEDFTVETSQIPVTFQPGVTTKTITVDLIADEIVEPNETFDLVITDVEVGGVPDADRAVMGPNAVATGKILNDDFANLTISDGFAAEGDAGATVMIFTATLDARVQGGLRIDYETRTAANEPPAIRAIAENDFETTAGGLVFDGNIENDQHLIPINIPGDTLTERDEVFHVAILENSLAAASGDSVQNAGAILVQAEEARGTIQNDDSILVTGAGLGGGPHVRVFHQNQLDNPPGNFMAYDGRFTGGVRVATGDVNGDGTPDVITAPGPGMSSKIRVFDGTNFTLIREFIAYDPGFMGGVFVSAADVNDDGRDDIITAAGAGGGPHVKVFSGTDGTELHSFFAYTPLFGGGVRIATGDVNADGVPDLITGAGAGGGPHVKVFDLTDSQAGVPNEIRSFFAFDAAYTGGVFVAGADFNRDDRADLVVSKGGGTGRVRIFDAVDQSFAQLNVFDGDFGGGLRVATVERVGDETPDLVVAAGPMHGPAVRIINGEMIDVDEFDQVARMTPTEGEGQFDTILTPAEMFSAYDPRFHGGVFVAGTVLPPGAGSPLRLPGDASFPDSEANPLSPADLNFVTEAAIQRLERAGLDAAAMGQGANTPFLVQDLSPGLLGLATESAVFIDVDAAGASWFLDQTPLADEEYRSATSFGLAATDSDGRGRVDLLSVVLHEMGHVLGMDDLAAEHHGGDWMADSLGPGLRRLPDEETLDSLFAEGNLLEELLLVDS